MKRVSTGLLALLLGAGGAARGQAPTDHRLDLLPRSATSTPTITPIFGQLLSFSMPAGFAAVNDAVEAGRYLQQSVPAGQSLLRWTEMITVTGEKDAARRPGITAKGAAEAIAGFFRRTCPDSFVAASFGPFRVARHEGFATVVGCGIADPVSPQSETLLLVTISGERELYTLQWAELGPPSKAAPTIDPAKWQDRLARIAPVRLCAIVPGEPPPYASCTRAP